MEEVLRPGLERGDPGAIYYASFLYVYGKAGFPVNIEKVHQLALAAAQADYLPSILDPCPVSGALMVRMRKRRAEASSARSRSS